MSVVGSWQSGWREIGSHRDDSGGRYSESHSFPITRIPPQLGWQGSLLTLAFRMQLKKLKYHCLYMARTLCYGCLEFCFCYIKAIAVSELVNVWVWYLLLNTETEILEYL